MPDRTSKAEPEGGPPNGRLWRIGTALISALVAIVSTTVLASAGGSGGGSAADDAKAASAPDIVLYNGKISTVDKRNSVVEGIAIRDGKILATGRSGAIRALAKRQTEVVNLRGRRVLPGLIDGHLHGMRNAYHCYTQTVRLDLVTRRAAALAAYRDKARALADGRWIWTTAGGWNVNQLDTPEVFTFDELTAAAPNNPVWVSGSGFTGPRVNQATLDALGLTPGSPGVELGPDGRPTGRLTHRPRPRRTPRSMPSSTSSGSRVRPSACRTSSTPPTAAASPPGRTRAATRSRGPRPVRSTRGCTSQEPTMHLYRKHGLDARIAYNDMSGYEGFPRVLSDTQNAVGFLGDDRLRYLGPGEDTMPTDPDYSDFTRYSAAKRLSVETHVGVIDPILDGFEAADEVYPVEKLKWRIAHPGDNEPSDEQLARAANLGVGWAETFSTVRNGAPGPRFRSTMESGRMCLASDAMNVAPWAPFQNLWYVTTGDTLIPGVPGVPAEQRLTRKEALRHATAECAWFIAQDGRVGTLEKGKHADLIVLSDDYFTVPARAIKDIRVEADDRRRPGDVRGRGVRAPRQVSTG